MSNDLNLDVAAIRAALGWSQQQLAEACGVDRSTVSRWESEPPAKGPALILLRQLQERVAETSAGEEPPTPSRPAGAPPSRVPAASGSVPAFSPDDRATGAIGGSGSKPPAGVEDGRAIAEAAE